MAKKQKRLNLSMSRILCYSSCPYKYYCNYVLKLPAGEDFPRLLGKVFHDFIKKLYDKTAEPRPFYYKTLDKARGAFLALYWWPNVHKAMDKIVGYTEGQAWAYSKKGVKCLENYWDLNFKRKKPIAVEKKFTCLNILPGVNIVGVVDQIREIDLKKIAEWRPELIIDGKLHPDYEPVVNVDIKTGADTYFITGKMNNGKNGGGKLSAKSMLELAKKDISESDKKVLARKQYPLHTNIQPTIYDKLVSEHYGGKKPILFTYYYPELNNVYPTIRYEEHYNELMIVIKDMVDNLEAQSYPKRRSAMCKWCDYQDQCSPTSETIVSIPSSDPIVSRYVVKQPERKKEYVQLKLGIKVKRKKKELPEINEGDKHIRVLKKQKS